MSWYYNTTVQSCRRCRVKNHVCNALSVVYDILSLNFMDKVRSNLTKISWFLSLLKRFCLLLLIVSHGSYKAQPITRHLEWIATDFQKLIFDDDSKELFLIQLRYPYQPHDPYFLFCKKILFFGSLSMAL